MRARLSQNFLFDPVILGRIVDAAAVGAGDTVVEVGPGPGRLTALLAQRARRVIAIELDRKLYQGLAERFGGVGNVELVRGDAMRYDYGSIREPFKVVANIPYHITTPLLFRLLGEREWVVSLTLTVQKEVAERIAAPPGGKAYGVLSLAVQYVGRPRVAFAIPRGAFRPVPKVDSACLIIEVREEPAVSVPDEGLLFHVIRQAFSKRRKTLRNALGSVGPEVQEALARAGVEPGTRPETVSLEGFAALTRELARLGVRAPADGTAAADGTASVRTGSSRR